MKNYFLYLLILLTFAGCHTDTGGPFDFMSDQISVISFLINNWWIVVIAVIVFIIIGRTKKK
jgi:hypothetical protein